MKKCFVAMPIREGEEAAYYKGIYDELFFPFFRELGYDEVRRGNEGGQGIVIQQVIQAIADADIVIGVTSYGQALDWLHTRTPDVLVVNKCDSELEQSGVDSIHIRNEKMDVHVSALSVKTGYGLDAFLERLTEMVGAHMAGAEDALIVRARHGDAIQRSIRHLNDARMISPTESELVADHVRLAARAMASITGHIDVEDMLGKIFSSFCIGK